MIEPANSSEESFRRFSLWLTAFFLAVLGAELRLVQLYGSPLPFWDQWYEAELFFRPWRAGHMAWQAFFAPDNGHRILCTRLVDLIVIGLNGRWEPLVQMTVNVFIHAVYAGGLACFLWHCLGRKNGWFICILLSPFFMLPYAGENAISAITLEYFLDIVSLMTLAGLGFARPGSGWWWLGLVAAFLSLFTMESGLLAPMTVAGLAVLRIVKHRRLARENLITLGACLAILGLGVALSMGSSVATEGDRVLRAQTPAQFLAALARNLTWPFFDSPVLAGLMPLPLLALAVWYFRPGFSDLRAAEFPLTLGLWGFLQSVGLAYGRGNYGGGFPVSRYLDIVNAFTIASVFALLPLAQCWRRGGESGKFTLLPPLIFCAVICFGLCRVSQIVVDGLLLPTRMMNLVAEERVSTLWTSGGTNAFFQPPTVRPSPAVALNVLRAPELQAILPAVCLPPTSPPPAGRFAAATQWLLEKSTFLLYGGLGLFAGLLGYRLSRDPQGLAWKNLPAFAALLALLAALGFVWSKAPLKRETVECTLQYQLADYFKSTGNLERAAIHEQKAEALKESAHFK